MPYCENCGNPVAVESVCDTCIAGGGVEKILLNGVKVLNCTSHPINIFRPEDTISDGRKLYLKDSSTKPVAVIPIFQTLNAKLNYDNIKHVIEVSGHEIPIFQPEVTEADTIPDVPNAFFIVSALYVQAQKVLKNPVDKLVTVSQPVYESPNNPRPIGCVGFNLPI